MGRATCGVVAIRRGESGSRRGQDSEGESPREGEAQESPGAARGEIQRRRALTGRGIKPLKRGRSGRDAYAPKAPEAPRKREGQAFGGLFDELVLVTANLVRCGSKKQALCLLKRSDANRRRGCLVERQWRSLSGKL